MTAEPQVTPPSERPGTEYTERLVSRTTRDVDRRLRMLVALTRQPLQHVLAALLGAGLPSADQLAGQMTEPAARKWVCLVCARLVKRQEDGLLAPHQRHSMALEAFIAAGDWVWVPCEGGALEATDER